MLDTVKANASTQTAAPHPLDPLTADEKSAFLDAYRSKLTQAYPTRVDGKSILRFPRLFIVAQR